MIVVRNVTYQYPEMPQPALVDASLELPDGAFCLVVGRSGGGKSTLLRTLNGLVPRFTGGRFRGQVTVAGQPVLQQSARQAAHWR